MSLVEVLLKKKANPLVRSKKGDSALDVAKTNVYDVIKEASLRAKEELRGKAKEGEKGTEAGASDSKNGTRKEADAKLDQHKKKPKKQKVVHLSHLEDE